MYELVKCPEFVSSYHDQVKCIGLEFKRCMQLSESDAYKEALVLSSEEKSADHQ